MRFLRPGEYSNFPYSVMEIKIKNPSANLSSESNIDFSGVQLPKKHGGWIQELTNSHLVKEVPKFSLYIQGVAALFAEEEKLDILPFWLPELNTDIRKDPKQAYEDEQKKINKQKDIHSKIESMRRLSRVPKPSSDITTSTVTEVSTNRAADLEDHESSDEEDSLSTRERRTGQKRSQKQN